MPREQQHAAHERRLTIVSDDAHYGKLLAYGLKMAGFSPEVVENDSNSIEVIRKVKPDLLIIDISIAVVEGLRMLHRLQNEGLSILVLSSSDDRAFSVESLVAGAEDVLVKPTTFPVILDRVKRLLGVRGTMPAIEH